MNHPTDLAPAAARDGSTVGPRPRPLPIAIAALVVLATATYFMLRRTEPFVTWYYLFAWYPTLLLLDCAVAARTGSYYLLTRPRFALSLLGWSAVLWFFFELINFRLGNWYYVFLPPARSARWTGTVLAFATVLPAIFLAERWLAARGLATRVRWPEFRVGPALRRAVFLTGIAFLALSLIWPRLFFPLIWGALTLLLEPWNHRRDPARSLLADLGAGRPGRVLRLTLGGLAIGFVWELFNIGARSKWIYTVPGLEELKLFEMPLAGFLGFPVFALDCFVAYQSLVLARVALPPERNAGGDRLRPGRTVAAVAAALVFSLAVLTGMDRWNTDSYTPGLGDLWLLRPAERERLAPTRFADPFRLARADPAAVAATADVPREAADRWVEAARLMTLRGIGAANARLLWRAGIRSVEELALADPGVVSKLVGSLTTRPGAATLPKVRVWVRAARRAASDGPTPGYGVSPSG